MRLLTGAIRLDDDDDLMLYTTTNLIGLEQWYFSLI